MAAGDELLKEIASGFIEKISDNENDLGADIQNLQKEVEGLGEVNLVKERVNYICRDIFEGDEAAAKVFELSFASIYLPSLRELLIKATGFSFCVKNGYGIISSDQPSFPKMKTTFDRLCRIFKGNKKAYPFFEAEFRCDDRLISYLEGDDGQDRQLSMYGKLFLAKDNKSSVAKERPYLQIHEFRQLLSKITERASVWILGQKDASDFIRTAAARSRINLVFADVSKISLPDMDSFMEIVFREAYFYRGYVCISGMQQLNAGAVYGFIMEAVKENVPMIISSEQFINLLQVTERYFEVLKVEQMVVV